MKAGKIFIAAVGVFFLINSAMAEETDSGTDAVKKVNPPSTLFKSVSAKKMTYSGYGGLYTRYSKIGEADACLIGGRGGFIMNDNFVIGLAGMGMTAPSTRQKVSGNDYNGLLNHIGFGYGGLLAEYYFNPKDLIVISAGTVIGGGTLFFYDKDYYDDDYDDDYNHHHDGDYEKGSNFFVVEPELNVFINITRFCRIGVGVSYRHVAGIEADEFSDKDFRGPTASVMAQFGWF